MRGQIKQPVMEHWSSNNIGVFDINYDTGHEYWSKHLRAMLGVPLDAPAGMHLLLQQIHRDDRRPLFRHLMRVWQPDCPSSFVIDVQIAPQHGVVRRLHLEASTSFRVEEPYDAVRTVGLAVDVTERVSLQLRASANLVARENLEAPTRWRARARAIFAAALIASAAVFLATVAAASGPIVTIGEPGAAEGVVLSAPTSEAIVRKALDEGELLGRMDTFYSLFHADFVDHTPTQGFSPTREGIRHLYIALRSAFPNLRATTDTEAGESSLITIRRTFEGTHRGAAFMKVEPSGRAVSFAAIDILRVHNGKITERWGVIDLASLLQQLRSSPPGGTELISLQPELAKQNNKEISE